MKIYFRKNMLSEASLEAQLQSPLVMQETWVQSLGQEDPLEKEMATHSSILAWKIPWTEESGRLQFMESQKESDMTQLPKNLTKTMFSEGKTGRQVSSCCPGFPWQAGYVVVVQSCLKLLETSWTVAHQAPLSPTISWL